MKKALVVISLFAVLNTWVSAGDILGLDISARYFSASGGSYEEKLSTMPGAKISGDFPASILEGTVKKNLLGPIYASGTFRYGTVPMQTMTLNGLSGGPMSTSIDAVLGGIVLNAGANFELGSVEFDLFGSGRYMWATKHFYDWKLNGAIIAPGSTAGRFLINWLSLGCGAKVTCMLGPILGVRAELEGYPLTSNNVDYINPSGAGKTSVTGLSYMYEGALVVRPVPLLEINAGYRFESVYFNENKISGDFDLLIKQSGLFAGVKMAF